MERVAHRPDNLPLQYPMRLTARFFSPAPQITSYTNMYTYPYPFEYLVSLGVGLKKQVVRLVGY